MAGPDRACNENGRWRLRTWEGELRLRARAGAGQGQGARDGRVADRPFRVGKRQGSGRGRERVRTEMRPHLLSHAISDKLLTYWCFSGPSGSTQQAAGVSARRRHQPTARTLRSGVCCPSPLVCVPVHSIGGCVWVRARECATDQSLLGGDTDAGDGWIYDSGRSGWPCGRMTDSGALENYIIRRREPLWRRR